MAHPLQSTPESNTSTLEREIAHARRCAEADANIAQMFDAIATGTDECSGETLRSIGPRPPNEHDYMEALGELLVDVDPELARALWRLVYDRGEPVPEPR